MMLHRSTSSRRRRASRSSASITSSSSAPQSGLSSQAGVRGRRASLASSEPSSEALMTAVEIDRQRSPRGSCVPNIALDNEEMFNRRLLPDPEQFGASRLSLQTPDVNRSSRLSLVPDDYNRSPRGSIIPDPNRPHHNRSPRASLVPDQRSPRHSLVPDTALSPRNSLVPSDAGYNRSPRGSLVPGAILGGSRTSLMPENGMSRSPRHSLVPDTSRSPRGSVANIDFDRSPRGSICPDPTSRSPRGSITPMDMHPDKKDRSPRGSIASECLNQSPRGSICPDGVNRSPRGSIAPEMVNRSPRGSIALQHDSISNRSPRGSLGGHRGSLGGEEDQLPGNRTSPRGSIGPISELDRSPRGSLAGLQTQERRLPKTGYPPAQENRRSSADQGTSVNRSNSPYRQQQQQPPQQTSGSVRSTGSGAPANFGYGTTAYTWVDSRRASSSVSQFSGDESRRLCAGGTSLADKGAAASNFSGPGAGGAGASGPMSVAAYGSLVYQLKDAHLEANGTCDFVFRALRVFSKTTIVTVFLVFLSTMPIVMLILGVQFMRDCPREPNIPIYMVVGGTLGGVRMFWTLYSQIRSRRPEVISMPDSRIHLSPKKLASILLSCFLVGWFALGNYWILSIRWPDYAPKLFEPNRWCHKTLYIFALLHLCVVYLAVFASVLTGLGLLFCRILACPWPERYK